LGVADVSDVPAFVLEVILEGGRSSEFKVNVAPVCSGVGRGGIEERGGLAMVNEIVTSLPPPTHLSLFKLILMPLQANPLNKLLRRR
jgi:hypothetical protein